MGYAMAASGRMQYDYKQTISSDNVIYPDCNRLMAYHIPPNRVNITSELGNKSMIGLKYLDCAIHYEN